VHAFVLGVVGDAVGLPREGRHHLLIFGELAMNLPGPHNGRYERALARVEKEGSRAWISGMAAREALTPEGFGASLYAMADRGEISFAEAAALIGTFLFAAIDSTAMTLINGLHAFASAPDQWLTLRADPSLARQAFDEVLRYRPAPQTLFRTTTSEVEIDGVRIPADQKIGFSLAGANRDPARWPDPNKFDIGRKSTTHLAFGAGVHACLGQMLAKLEAECLLGALARRVRLLEFAGTPLPFANNAMSSYSSLPLRFTAV
jgi:cytochrome P450